MDDNGNGLVAQLVPVIRSLLELYLQRGWRLPITCVWVAADGRVTVTRFSDSGMATLFDELGDEVEHRLPIQLLFTDADARFATNVFKEDDSPPEPPS